jgi:hypothetical protein
MFFTLILLGVNSCKKVENPTPPSVTPEVEQQLVISTDPSNSVTLDVKDTLNLKVNVTSKMPLEVIYSVEVIRLDSNKSIFKIDSTFINSRISNLHSVFY